MYEIASTHAEVRGFKISARAVNKEQVKLDSNKGLIRGVSDNFDAHLSN